jgi:hypothetical protein
MRDETMQILQRYGRTVQLAMAVAAGILLMATAVKPQMPAVGPVWEYSSVTSTPSDSSYNGNRGSAGFDTRATICYASATGCRSEQVTVAMAESRQIGDAMMLAAAKLGEKGWELAATTDATSDSRHERVMYFKRLRSVLNRQDSRQ